MAEDLEEDFDEGEASDDAGESSGSHGGGGGGGKKKLILFIVLPLLLVIGAGAGAYFSGLLDGLLHKSGGETEAAAEPKSKAEKKEAAPEHPTEVQASVFYDLPEILVNLNSPGRKQNFLKIRVSLELESALDVGKIEAVMPRIIDNFQVYLRELRVDDLQGSAGMLRLREELMTRVNNAVKPAKVNDVLFKEMLVQ
ncbi:MAG TPA: flagellar basal body-associated FliL family protein [Candidatus Sulfotelmatobacter sp.]|jgi:flagellar FliL protein|nr:flagellar basal body-associated FliL family protein [Candidatus Sulfotelmatobacter sp.]